MHPCRRGTAIRLLTSWCRRCRVPSPRAVCARRLDGAGGAGGDHGAQQRCRRLCAVLAGYCCGTVLFPLTRWWGYPAARGRVRAAGAGRGRRRLHVIYNGVPRRPDPPAGGGRGGPSSSSRGPLGDPERGRREAPGEGLPDPGDGVHRARREVAARPMLRPSRLLVGGRWVCGCAWRWMHGPG